MTAVNPPTFVVSTYNPSFFDTTTTSLSQGQANLLYLQKTVPDTSNVLETFSAGINTTAVEPIATNQAINIGSTQLSNSINIGTNAAKSGLINIGASSSTGNYGISMGCATGLTKIYSPIQCVSTLDSSGGGTLSIGTVSSATTGITIGNTSVCPIQIGNATTTSTIVINTASTLNTNATPAIAIGTSASVKTIKINNETNSVHCSSIDLQTSSINNIVNTTGALSIADKQTTGILNIGTSATRGGAGTLGQINIGNLSNTAFIMNIGSSLSTMNLRGILSIGTTDKNISIGRLNTGTAGVEIGNTNSPTTVYGVLNASLGIVTTALDYAGTVAIANVNATALNIGNTISTGIIRIGGSASRTAVLYLGAGTGASGQVQIGGTTGNVLVNNTLQTTNGLTVGGPITLGTVPSASAHLGYVFGGDISGSTPVTSGTVVSSITIAQTGTFLFSWYYQQYFPSTAPTQPTMSFSGYGGSMGFVTVTPNYNECNGDAIISRTTSTSTTYNLIFNYIAAGSMTTNQGFFKAVRVG